MREALGCDVLVELDEMRMGARVLLSDPYDGFELAVDVTVGEIGAGEGRLEQLVSLVDDGQKQVLLAGK